mgnify:CR=1 FL=1
MLKFPQTARKFRVRSFFLLLTPEELKNVRARYEGTALENITSWYQYYFAIISYL